MLPLFLWCMTRSKRSVFAVVGSATAAVTVLISTAALMKAPPSRVYFPVLTFPLALLLLMARDQISVPWRRWLGFRLTPWIVAVFDRRNAPLSVQEFSSEVLAEKFAESVRRGGMLPVACRDCGTAHQSVSASCLGRVVVMPPLPGDRRCPNWPATWRAQAVRLLSRPTPAQVFAMLTIVGLMYGVSHQYRRSARMQIARHDLMQSLEDLHPRDDQLYVVCVPDFPYEAISPFDSLTSFVHLHQLVLGWPQRTPISQAMKQKFEIVDVARALYQRSDVFFVGDFRWCHAIYQKYIQEHYGVAVNFVVSFVGGHTYDAIGQFESRTDPALADAAKTLPDSCQDDSDSITLTVSESRNLLASFELCAALRFRQPLRVQKRPSNPQVRQPRMR